MTVVRTTFTRVHRRCQMESISFIHCFRLCSVPHSYIANSSRPIKTQGLHLPLYKKENTQVQRRVYSSYTIISFIFSKLLELLLETKANGCVRDMKHKTPLHLAADRGTARQVKVLTQAAPSCVWMRDDQRRTPLHYAVSSLKRYFLIVFYVILRI